MKTIEVNISPDEKEIYYAISRGEAICFGIGFAIAILIGVYF